VRSPADTIAITAEDGTAFDLWTSVEILNSVVRSNEASFEVGDDGSWQDLSHLAQLGTRFTVRVNGNVHVTGRVEVLNAPLSAQQSSVVRFVVRTIMSDFASNAAHPRVRVKDRSIREVVEAAIFTMSEKDAPRPKIEFRADVSRELITGRKTRGGAGRKDLEPLKEDAAAVQPGETIKSFVDRHLRRHGLMWWDSPSGAIVVDEPDDDQEATYVFRCLRGAEGKYNNVLGIDRSRDVTGAPSHLYVFGYGGGKDFARAKVQAGRKSVEIIDAGFVREVMIVDEGVRTHEMANRTAAREFSERIRRLDTFTVSCDGLSYTERGGRINYAPDTTCDIIADTIGGSVGKYYVEQVLLRRSAEGADVAQIQTVKAGTWTL